MKNAILLCLLGISVCIWSQDSGELVRKCVAAMGGEKGIQNFSNYQASGDLKVQRFGHEIPAKYFQVAQNRRTYLKAEVEFDKNSFKFIIAYDGKEGWMDMFNTITTMPALNFESEENHHISLLTNKDAVFSSLRETEIDGRKAIGIEADVKGKKTIFFIDSETFLVKQIEFEDYFFGDNNQKELTKRKMRWDDYRKFGAGLFPCHWVIYMKDNKNMEMFIKDVKFNPAFAVEYFSKPDQKLDLRYSEEIMD